MRSRFLIFILIFISSARLISLPALGYEAEYTMQQQEPADPGAKKKLAQKLIDSFKFKKNSRDREAKRITDIVNRLLMKDTAITGEKLRLLSKELQDTVKIHYDELLQIIRSLTTDFQKLKSEDSAYYAKEGPLAAEQGISEHDMDNLVAKLVPILSEKAQEEKAEEERQEKLKRVRLLLAKGGTITDSLAINDSVRKVYTLKLVKRGEVYGFNPYWIKERYQNYNFQVLSTLIFYGYELDWNTGNYLDLHGWDSSRAIDAAQKNGCRVTLAVYISNADNISVFLKNAEAQKKLVNTVATLLENKKANGVHLIFENLKEEDGDRFVRLLRYFSSTLREANPDHSISISVPAMDEGSAYNVQDLDPYVDKFIIDFTKINGKVPGPIAPLQGGNNSMASGIAYYLNKNISPDKFIACLPYHGLKWTLHAKKLKYPAYNEIQPLLGNNRVVYDPVAVTARIDSLHNTDTVAKLWYDDAKTLNKKYDYLINNGLGGAAIWALGYDNGYGELWSLLMEKFVGIDTVNIKIVRAPGPEAPKSLWERIKAELREYRAILENPCHESPKSFKTDDYIGFVLLFFLALSLIVGFIFVTNIRNKGDAWAWRKATLRILVVLMILLLISTFMYFFLNKNIPFVGLTKEEGKCQPMPFSSLIIILSAGFISGLLVMRFLIVPLIKKDDTP
jgi:hypothetical protein